MSQTRLMQAVLGSAGNPTTTDTAPAFMAPVTQKGSKTALYILELVYCKVKFPQN